MGKFEQLLVATRDLSDHHALTGRWMQRPRQGQIAAALFEDRRKWHEIFTHFLPAIVPLDILHETIDYLTETIVDANIPIAEADEDLTLQELEGHPLTCTLEQELSPLVSDSCTLNTTASGDFSWALFTADCIERYLHLPSPSDSSETGATEGGLDGVQATKNRSYCELCMRQMPLTAHHLVPRSTHAYFLAHPHLLSSVTRYPLDEHFETGTDIDVITDTATLQTNTQMQNSTQAQTSFNIQEVATKEGLRRHVAWLCRPCHTHVHATITDHKELGQTFNTVGALRTHPDITKFVAWVAKQRGSDKRMVGKGIRYRR